MVVRRYIDFFILLIPTPLVSTLFCSSIPTFCYIVHCPLLFSLPLTLQYFKELRERVISMQPVERQNAMMLSFDNLMDGIEGNLQPRNRDM